MTEKYRVDYRRLIDCEGRADEIVEGKTYYDSRLDAAAKGYKMVIDFIEGKHDAWVFDGDFMIVKRQIDEAAFTVEDSIVYKFHYYTEIQKNESMECELNSLIEANAKAEKTLKHATNPKTIVHAHETIAANEIKIDELQKKLSRCGWFGGPRCLGWYRFEMPVQNAYLVQGPKTKSICLYVRNFNDIPQMIKDRFKEEWGLIDEIAVKKTLSTGRFLFKAEPEE